MQISGKYVGIISFLVLIVLTSGCISISSLGSNSKNTENLANDTSYTTNASIPTKTYSSQGISFKYPGSWRAYSENATVGNNVIIATKGYSYSTARFQVQIMNNNGMPEENVVKELQRSITPGWDRTGKYKLTVDNKTAYEAIYNVNSAEYDETMRMAEIILVKNDKTYLMLLQAPDKSFNKEKSNFGVILNSFKVL